ncbi:MAG TPA: hypothetical protein VGK32_23460 [Vicinamibacterales bacterium]
MMDTDAILKQLDSILQRHFQAVNSDADPIPASRINELLTSAEAAIQRLAPPGSAYLSRGSEALKANGADEYRLELLMGVVAALRHDLEVGGLLPIQELIRAEVFDDFLDMADHLLALGYKDPAAVLASGVLEQHLRTLCRSRNIATDVDGKPKSADSLNSELARVGAYNKLDQKSVTSWQDLRNKAAHGEYVAYDARQVQLVILGIRDFARRIPL